MEKNTTKMVGEIVNKDDPMEAYILKAKKIWDGYVVLCFTPLRKEFIVWWMDENSATFYGEYFTNLNDAFINFKSRN